MDALNAATEIPAPSRLVEWGVAEIALGGGEVSGDRHAVREFRHGVLIGVVDGLGHGPAAAAAAEVAVDTVKRHATEPVESLMRRCHEALRKTRGVAMSLASIDGLSHTMSWIGVGNVEGALLSRARAGAGRCHRLLLRGGVVGYRLPPLQASVVPIGPGDILTLATDGVRGGFAEGVSFLASPERNAEHILARFGKTTDDSLVLVARYRGSGP